MTVYEMVTSEGSLVSGIVSGAVAGILFGLLMAAFSEFQHRGGAKYDPSGPEEALLRWEVARRRATNGETADGYLYLTGERLVFLPRHFSLPDDELSIPLGEIFSVRPGRTVGVLPNAVEVVHAEACERFVVGDRRGWIRQVRRHSHQRPSQAAT